ncbi:MAG: DUF3237 domain-containing protein [Dehalococcoidia bacterium]|nr:DUF3237 domain-containing protein [Dehalococcoidia bacterium]
MAESSLPVEHLFTLTATTEQVAVLDGAPQGTRSLVRVTGGTFEGPRIKGTIEEGGGDWITVRADGSAKLDVRLTLRTADGAHVLMTYQGIAARGESGLAVRTAPLFETGDARYSWLNNLQAVAHGAPARGSVTYEVYALK